MNSSADIFRTFNRILTENASAEAKTRLLMEEYLRLGDEGRVVMFGAACRHFLVLPAQTGAAK